METLHGPTLFVAGLPKEANGVGLRQPSGAWSKSVTVEVVLQRYTCGRLRSLGKGVKGPGAVPPGALWAVARAPSACAHFASWGMAGVRHVGTNPLQGGSLGVVSQAFSDPDLGA